MLCDDCKKNEANVYMTQIIGNQKTEKHLCESCARKYGDFILNAGGVFPADDFADGMFTGPSDRERRRFLPKAENRKCPNCKMAYRDFVRTGKIGCSECYKAFNKQLLPIVRRLNGSSLHMGKIPEREGREIVIRKKLSRLQKELEKCIAKEEYEQAAKCRDDIKLLEKQTAGEVE